MTAGQAGTVARQPESHYIRSLVNVSVREALYGLSARCCYPVIQQATLRAETAHIGEADNNGNNAQRPPTGETFSTSEVTVDVR